MNSPALEYTISELMHSVKAHNHNPWTDEIYECPICKPLYDKVAWVMDLLKSEWTIKKPK